MFQQTDMVIKAKDISWACKQIMDDPMVKRVTTATERDKAFTQAKKNQTAPQEIVFDNTRSTTAFYVNIKENINIELRKSLYTITIGRPSDEKTLQALKETGQLIEKKIDKDSLPEYSIIMQPWDISFHFLKTTLSENISKKPNNKHGIHLLWTKCFIEQSAPAQGFREDESYTILLATQNDLKTTLERLQKME